MINPLAQYLKLYTTFDGGRMFLIGLLLYLVVSVYAYYKTESNRLVNTIASAFILGEVIFMTILAATQLLGAHLDAYVLILQAVIWLISMLNLGSLIDHYISELGNKKFDEDHITRAHYTTSLKHGVLIILISSAMLPLTEISNIWLPTTLGLAGISTLAINHLLARRFLKDTKTSGKEVL